MIVNVKVNYPIVGRSSGWCFLKPKNDSPGVLMISGFDFLFVFRDFCSMGFCLGLYKHRGYSSSFGTLDIWEVVEDVFGLSMNLPGIFMH